MLFDTFVTTVWKPSCAKLRECTKVGYESTLNCHILPQWSGRNMDAIGERTERFRDGLIRRRVVLLATAGELDVAVDRDDATDAT